MPTILDVAKRAGVSIATVSNTLSGARFVTEELQKRVLRAIEELHYSPNSVAKSLRTGSSKVISIIISDFDNPFFAQVLQGAADAAFQLGYTLIMGTSHEVADTELRLIQTMISRQVDGIIIAPSADSNLFTNPDVNFGIHTILINRIPEGSNLPAVVTNEWEAAFEAVGHFIHLGHERIGIILPLKGLSTTKNRLRGYLDSLSANGIEVDQSLIIHGDSTIGGALEATKQLLSISRPPTAILSCGTTMTLGIMKALKNLHKKCPNDVAVIAFCNTPWAEISAPPLTCIVQPAYEIGRVGVEKLIRLIEEDNSGVPDERLASVMVHRESCGCAEREASSATVRVNPTPRRKV